MKSEGSMLSGLVVLIAIMLFTVSAAFAVPTTVNYQGYLTDDSGVPVSGTVSITFRVYDAPTGGTLKWNETRDVEVNNGVYSVQLGTGGGPLDESVFTGADRYLEVEIDGTPLSPRLSFSSNAYAIRAGMADGVADGQVSTIMVADGAITAAKLATDSVGSAQIATDAVGSSEIASNSVGTAELATGSVTSSKISVPLSLSGTDSGGLVKGINTSSGYGVYGKSNGGAGVFGENTGFSGSGVIGKTSTSLGAGVFGNNISGGKGVYGTSSGTAVYGSSTGTDGYGVHGYGQTGVYGETSIVNGTGVSGYSTGNASKGIYGESDVGTGVYGNSSGYGTGGTGVYGSSNGTTGTGVYGIGFKGVHGYGIVNGIGVYGYSSGSDGIGVSGYNVTGGYAGYFVGDVTDTGNLTVSGTVTADSVITNSVSYDSPKTYYKIISPVEFMQRGYSSGSDYWQVTTSYDYISTGTAIVADAPVNLPQGATITEFGCYYYDNDATYNLSMNAMLAYADPTALNAYQMAKVNPTSSGDSLTVNYVSETNISFATIDNGTNSYAIQLTFSTTGTSTNLRFKGCRITYTMNTVAP